MKGIDKYIKENSINEAREIEYRAALSDATDNEGLPISVTILVERPDQKAFEAWAEREEGNTLSHCEGGNIMY